MQFRRVACPMCETLLVLPPGFSNCAVRCGQCQTRFRLPKRVRVTDEAVASWLFDDEETEAEHAAAESGRTGESGEREYQPEPHAPARTMVLRTSGDAELKLLRLDREGALFEFPAGNLKDPGFRSAVPRRCLQCGSRTNLWAHVIIYSRELLGSISVEDEHAAGALSLSESEARTLTDEEVLERLPRVPSVPPPADLPMPYWLCNMCTGADPISGQIRVNSDTGRGACRLLIRNVHRASEFALAAAGPDHPAHAKLAEWADSTAESPWDALPLLVQRRLEQWFRPESGEQFLAYVADRDRTRNEDGMAGMVISDRRLVYHTRLRHRELPPSAPMEIILTVSGRRGNIRLRTDGWELKHFSVDREGINRLRRGLTLGKFQANWH